MTSSSHRMIVLAQYKFLQATIDSSGDRQNAKPAGVGYSGDPINLAMIEESVIQQSHTTMHVSPKMLYPST